MFTFVLCGAYVQALHGVLLVWLLFRGHAYKFCIVVFYILLMKWCLIWSIFYILNVSTSFMIRPTTRLSYVGSRSQSLFFFKIYYLRNTCIYLFFFLKALSSPAALLYSVFLSYTFNMIPGTYIYIHIRLYIHKVYVYYIYKYIFITNTCARLWFSAPRHSLWCYFNINTIHVCISCERLWSCFSTLCCVVLLPTPYI